MFKNPIMLAKEKTDLLHDFFSMSTWQTLVCVIVLILLITGLWFLIKKTKIKFVYHVLIGLGLGLVFGVVIQAINRFPFDPTNGQNTMINKPISDEKPNPLYTKWVHEFSIWTDLIKIVFMNAILLLTVPVVFLAILRSTSKPSADKKTRKALIITVSILLVNVAVAFLFTYAIGSAFNIGKGFNLTDNQGTSDNIESKPLPEIIYDYVPSNFADVFVKAAIVPVMILAGLIGYGIKRSSKRHPQEMEMIRASAERWWTVMMSCLMTVVKIMPYAVMCMILNAIIKNPIGNLANIGIIIGVAYLCLVIALIWHSLTLILFGINPFKWWKKAIRPVIQGFTTQSSSAALPLTMDTLKNDLKVNENLVGLSAPLSTTMGLTACAGVQSGIVVSFIATSGVFEMTWANFFMAFIVVIIASIGIAGVPGTASVVTAGVLGGLGIGFLFKPVYSIIGALDGLFDMGRTAVNVSGSVQATTIAAKLTKQLETDELYLTKRKKGRSKKQLKLALKNEQNVNSNLLKKELKALKKQQKQTLKQIKKQDK